MPIDREKATLSLDEPVSRVRLVSPARAAALEKLGVRTLRDLLTHFPRSYIDLSQVETCGTARIGVYPRKRIPTVDIFPGEPGGPPGMCGPWS